jgi:Na+/H+-translocating membrane pyrophosphatase
LVTVEVERQVRDLRQAQGTAVVPSDYAPSYKACVEAVVAAARGTSLIELLVLLVTPFVLGSLLMWSGAAGSERTLASFGIASVLAGLILTLAGRATRAALREVRRRLRSSDIGAPSAALEAQSFGDLLGVTAATSAEALALVLALTVLCLAPLLR